MRTQKQKKCIYQNNEKKEQEQVNKLKEGANKRMNKRTN